MSVLPSGDSPTGGVWSDAYGWIPNPWPTPGYGTCNCACQRCLAGSCCQFGPYVPTRTTTGTGVAVGLHEHRWQPVGLSRGDVIQSCECGDVRRVSVP